jgi:hypothetical protein
VNGISLVVLDEVMLLDEHCHPVVDDVVVVRDESVHATELVARPHPRGSLFKV